MSTLTITAKHVYSSFEGRKVMLPVGLSYNDEGINF